MLTFPLPKWCVLIAGAVVLVILAAIDAAYSGDWSRIGVISKDVELGLRPLLALLGFFHIFCGGVAAIAASKKGYNPVPPTMKVCGRALFVLLQTTALLSRARHLLHLCDMLLVM